MFSTRALLPLLATALFLSYCVSLAQGPRPRAASPASRSGVSMLLERSVVVASEAPLAVPLPGLEAGRRYSVSIVLRSPETWQPAQKVRVQVSDARGVVAAKPLEAGDADLYCLLAPREDGDGTITLRTVNTERAAACDVRVLAWPIEAATAVTVEAEPNDTWDTATPLTLERPVFATADDGPYLFPGETDETGARRGIDWYRFAHTGRPKLVYFAVEVLGRDNIPPDVALFTESGDRLRPYENGAAPASPPREVQSLPGSKFATRVIQPGVYYVRVTANHPVYQLRTRVYDVPPYDDPRAAVRAGVDYLVNAGDAWHANTPRLGGLTDRIGSVHAETAQCIACHPTQFAARGALTARENGYPIAARAELQFLAERLANNPRPFYGHPEATWARVISAPANVMSRLASLVHDYDTLLSGEEHLPLLKGAAGYLKLYYAGRTRLPDGESNGNTPAISAYEVAFYSWKVFDALARRTGEREYARYRDQIRGLLEEDRHRDLIDLCYQTLAFVTIDRATYAARIRANCERLLALQRPDGRWAMEFDAGAPAAEFQTGHCLYTLAVAGYTPEHPRLAAAVRGLLQRQQPFGGWFDPEQPYENFRTPFRETQFAVMALSQLYPEPKRAGIPVSRSSGVQTTIVQTTNNTRRTNDDEPSTLNAQHSTLNAQRSTLDAQRSTTSTQHLGSWPDTLIAGLDGIWEKPGAGMGQVLAALEHPEPLVRHAAAMCLGRVGDARAVAPLARRLGDPVKVAREGAVWALRRLAARGFGGDAIGRALASGDAVTRRGATRVFAEHFAALSHRGDLAQQMLGRLRDADPVVRMQAAKALWQWWYWTRDDALRGRIEDAFVGRLAVAEHPWVRRGLTEGLYNIADENLGYLHNNWIPLLAQPTDREHATAAYRATSRRLAGKLAAALNTGNELQVTGILQGISQFHLRDGNYFRTGRYSRIGNDAETVRFSPDAAALLEPALLRLLKTPDAGLRQRAILAAYTVRGVELPELPRAVLLALSDEAPGVRVLAREFYRSLRVAATPRSRAALAATLAGMLASPYPEAQIAALEVACSAGPALAGETRIEQAIRSYLAAPEPRHPAPALAAAAAFPSLHRDAVVQAVTARGLLSEDAAERQAAAHLALFAPAVGSAPAVTEALSRLLASAEPAHRQTLLELARRDPALSQDARIIRAVTASLRAGEGRTQRLALQVVQGSRSLRLHAAVREALATLREDPNERTRQIASALLSDEERQAEGAPAPAAARARAEEITRLLDLEYFRHRVQPLFAARGEDGNTCIGCHLTHNLLRLTPPAAGGRFTDAETLANYRSALAVVDLDRPENSLLLRKPTSSSEGEGTAGSGKIAHGGGRRWSGPEHPAYRAVLEWINGARLQGAE